MPVIVAWLLNGLRILITTRVGQWILSALAFFGLSFATHNYAFQPALDLIAGLMQSGPGGGDLGPKVLAWAGVMKLDVAVSMLLSAHAAAWGIKGARVFLSRTPT